MSNDALNQVIDMLLTEAAEVANENESFEVAEDDVEFSEKHEEKMKKLFKKEKRKNSFKKTLKNYRFFVCLLLLVGMIVCAVNYCVKRQYDPERKIVDEDKIGIKENSVIVKHENSTLGNLCFEYIPEGFRIVSQWTAEESAEVEIEDGNVKILYCKVPIEENQAVDAENGEMVTINGLKGTIVKNVDSNVLMWQDDKYLNTITSSSDNGSVIAGEEIIKIAENIRNVITDKSEVYTIDNICFKYIPDGYKVIEESISDRGVIKSVYVIFHDGTTEVSYYKVSIRVKTTIFTENAEITNITVNGKERVLIKKEQATTLVWHDDEYRYNLSSSGQNGPISEEEFIKIAENIENI